MEPKLKIEEDTAQRGGAPDRWKVTWSIQNLGEAPLTILAARLPHSKFRCEEIQFAKPLDLGPNGSDRLQMEVRCGEAPGSIVENAFLIMRLLCTGNQWLVLARLRVSVSTERTPSTTTELITAQPVGFSDQ